MPRTASFILSALSWTVFVFSLHDVKASGLVVQHLRQGWVCDGLFKNPCNAADLVRLRVRQRPPVSETGEHKSVGAVVECTLQAGSVLNFLPVLCRLTFRTTVDTNINGKSVSLYCRLPISGR